ncbi:MAG: phosphotransferase system glucose/maltose/N-acetylglucosamine-specific IIC component [Urechidicola sp.]|jgi:phosphotransferase system  glucose/maltose/N-acetylglucosamine-specific IIC component
MIADNLLYIAIFVFIIMFIGLVLTFLEFHYGKPKRQQELAEKNPEAAGGDMPAR